MVNVCFEIRLALLVKFFKIIFITCNKTLHFPRSILKPLLTHFVSNYSTLIDPSPQKNFITGQPPTCYFNFHIKEQCKVAGTVRRVFQQFHSFSGQILGAEFLKVSFGNFKMKEPRVHSKI